MFFHFSALFPRCISPVRFPGEFPCFVVLPGCHSTRIVLIRPVFIPHRSDPAKIQEGAEGEQGPRCATPNFLFFSRSFLMQWVHTESRKSFSGLADNFYTGQSPHVQSPQRSHCKVQSQIAPSPPRRSTGGGCLFGQLGELPKWRKGPVPLDCPICRQAQQGCRTRMHSSMHEDGRPAIHQ